MRVQAGLKFFLAALATRPQNAATNHFESVWYGTAAKVWNANNQGN